MHMCTHIYIDIEGQLLKTHTPRSPPQTPEETDGHLHFFIVSDLGEGGIDKAGLPSFHCAALLPEQQRARLAAPR